MPKILSALTGLAIALGIVLPVITGESRYLTNDDPGYALMASGLTYGSPTGTLIFISVPMGEAIAFAYATAHTLPWYAIFMLATIAIALIGPLLVATGIRPPIPRATTSVAVFLLTTFATVFMFELHFSQTAILSSGLGTCTALLASTRRLQSLGLASIAIGVLWRPDAGMLAAVVTLLFFAALLPPDRWRRYRRRLLTSMIVLVLTYAVCYLSWNDWGPYLAAETRDFVTFNSARGLLDGGGGFASTTRAQDLALSVGLTSNEWSLFKSWYFPDKQIFTSARLQGIASHRPIVPDELTIASAMTAYLSNIRLAVEAAIVLFSAVMISQYRTPWNYRFRVGICIVFLATFFIFLSTTARLPESISSSLIIIAAFAISLTSGLLSPRIRGRYGNAMFQRLANRVWGCTLGFISLAVIGSAVTLAALLIAIDTKRSSHPLPEETAAVRLYAPPRPLVAFPSYYSGPFASTSPFSTPEDDLPHWYSVIPLGTSAQSPDFEAKLRHMGLSTDLISEIAKGNALIATADGQDLARVEEQITSKTGKTVSWKLLFSDGAGRSVWTAVQ